MRAKTQQITEYLRGSLWFIPTVLVGVAIGLAWVMGLADRQIGAEAAVAVPLVFDAGPAGARQVLSTIAGSVLTVAGVAFSMTVVILSFASTQFSSRTLRNFMQDRVDKFVLGALLATFVYCLLVLRTVRGSDGPDFVPGIFVPVLSVTVALGFALLDLGLFAFFLHHIAESFQVHSVITRVGNETSKAIDRLYPEPLGEGDPDAPLDDAPLEDGAGVPVRAARPGYLQGVDPDRILTLAQEHDLQIRIARPIGVYIGRDEVLARVAPADHLTPPIGDAIRGSFTLGSQRTITQDAGFGFVQLSDIALKALSPGVNDPTTALMCLDQFDRLLGQLIRRSFPLPQRRDATGRLCLIVRRAGFADLVAGVFDPLRRYGMGDAAIPLKMLEILKTLAGETDNPDRQAVLALHADALIADCRQHFSSPRDRRLLGDRINSLPAALAPGWQDPLERGTRAQSGRESW